MGSLSTLPILLPLKTDCHEACFTVVHVLSAGVLFLFFFTVEGDHFSLDHIVISEWWAFKIQSPFLFKCGYDRIQRQNVTESEVKLK